MATLLSFVSVIVALILLDAPIAIWLGQRHKTAHAIVAGFIVVLTLAGWTMNTARAWVNSSPERLEVLKTEMIRTSEKVLRLTNYPEDRKAHPIDQLSKDHDLRKLVNDTNMPLWFVPTGVGIASDLHGHTVYNMYIVCDNEVFRQEVDLHFKWNGSWTWTQAVFGELHEVPGPLAQEPGFVETEGAWYNPGH